MLICVTGPGDGTRFVVSEMSGRSTLELKAVELGLDLAGANLGAVLDELKAKEYEGYHFEVADASLELLLRRATGWAQPYFRLESYRVITEELDGGRTNCEATVKVLLPDVAGVPDAERRVAVAEGNGPVNALDSAFRLAVLERFPVLASVHLTDYKVRVLDTSEGTGARIRVLIDSTDGERSWSTIGVSENVIDASWLALQDSLVFALLHASDRR